VLGILATLLGIVIVNIGNIRSSASVNTTVTTLTTDIKNQQTKAMTGDTEGRGTPDSYGIYIQPSQYVLFHGAAYNSSDTSNFTVPVDENYQLLTTFTNNTIIFASGSGQITNLVTGQNTIVVRNPTTGQQKTMTLNKYGAITSVN
jgi:hypothetical protein